MVRCNLAVLLAEQNLKITKVSSDTGISRTTLTALTSNYCQGIQLDTLNALCLYLSVTPNELFTYVPFDVKINDITLNFGETRIYTVNLTINEKTKTTTTDVLQLEVILKTDSDDVLVGMSLYCFLSTFPDNEIERDKVVDEIIKEKTFIRKIFPQIPRAFLIDLQNTIINMFLAKFKASNNINVAFEWDSDLS